jgi:hypothetical protein
MEIKEEVFTSLSSCQGPPIITGDNTPVVVAGEGRVELPNGIFENVLHVPNLSMNLLSVYQITHKGKKIEFTSDSVSILDMMTITISQLVRWITNQGCTNSLIFPTTTLLFHLHISFSCTSNAI